MSNFPTIYEGIQSETGEETKEENLRRGEERLERRESQDRFEMASRSSSESEVPAEHSDSALPPPYVRSRLAGYLEAELRSFPGGDEITTASVPQWTWPRSACRLWIYLMVLEKCERGAIIAYETACRFNGFGPALYIMFKSEWRSLLHESPEDSMTIYYHLLAMRNEKGAVPPAFEISHSC
ncbi:hypothetical protein BOTCAL_0702g00040 [Botryotinia calthae]|uniref:Uncharacterized protein n=1 Tax=Botryotinia calthae TaxID=38488 RepID=A0A4Y8CIU3_9HELO|nr:hypothetical protein BOTCAL_0702g00040 [Botryotinia calthae]